MTFWGRDGERKRIHKMLGDDAMTIALIYGRRRVGKSELIKHASGKRIFSEFITSANKLRK